jgi:hypothetical protein
MHIESDRKYITGKDSLGILSWNTINAKAVYLDGSEVDPSGSMEVRHHQGTTHTLIAEGEKQSDTAVYEFVLYSPEVNRITLSATEKTFYTDDTVTVTATYTDQHGYPLNDTVIGLQWSISLGKGTLFGADSNSVLYTSAEAGNAVVKGSYMGVNGGITLKVKERDHTSIENNAVFPGITVFPNPFRDHITFTFKLEGTGEGYLKIMDLQGRTCLHRKIDPGEIVNYRLDTRLLPEGTYLYEMGTGKSVVTGKLVKLNR